MLARTWERISDAGVRPDDSYGDRKTKRVSNQIATFFLLILFIMVLVSTTIFSFLVDFEKYGQFAFPYIGSEIAIWFTILFFHLLKVHTGNLEWMYGAYYAGVVFVVWFSMMLGESVGFQTVLLIMVPVPFFFFRSIRLWLIVTGQLSIVACYLFITWWYKAQGALYPMPQHILDLSFLILTPFVVLSIGMCAYYLWNQNEASQLLLEQEKEIVAEAHQQLQEKDQVMQMQLSFAREIQLGVMPETTEWKGFAFSATYQPLGSVSGDYYDIIPCGDSIFVLIADVSGHGMPAALITMLAKRLFSDTVRPGRTPARILVEVNHQIGMLVKTAEYLTAFLVRIDEGGEMVYSNAGHTHPLLIKKNGAHEFLDTPGTPLGLTEHHEYEDRKLQLTRGDALHLFTDGLTEQRDVDGDHFENERLQQALAKSSDHMALLRRVKEHRGHAAVEDDMTILSVEFTG